MPDKATNDAERPEADGATKAVKKVEDTDNDEPPAEKSGAAKFFDCLKKFYFTNEFLILIFLAILLALAYPPIGATYLAPKITATWVGKSIHHVLFLLFHYTQANQSSFTSF